MRLEMLLTALGIVGVVLKSISIYQRSQQLKLFREKLDLDKERV